MISDNAWDKQDHLLVQSDYDLNCLVVCIPSLYVERVLQ